MLHVIVKRFSRECQYQFRTTILAQTSAKKRIASINARGLEDKVKRQETFRWLREKKYLIFFVQEAHCSDSSMHDWRAEWVYQALFSCSSSKKAGVAILFNNNFVFQISKSFVDPEGRFIICDLNTSGKQITLANIYAPNDDNPNFLQHSLSIQRTSIMRTL